MTRRAIIALAVIAVAVALVLGAIDYETRGVADLFTAENIPALTLFAVVAFVLLSGCYLAAMTVKAGVVGLWSWLRTPGAR